MTEKENPDGGSRKFVYQEREPEHINNTQKNRTRVEQHKVSLVYRNGRH